MADPAKVGVVPPRRLADHLLAHGRPVVTLAEVAALTGLTTKAAADALVRLRRAHQMFSPHRGLYVAVPPQYRLWGVVPALDFIDPMMQMMRRRYYVGLLSAAELHGSSHQRPQLFQVMVDRVVADRDFERVRLRFYSHTRLGSIPVQQRNSATGQVRVSTPEATCLDLVTRPGEAGGLSNVATVVSELAGESGLETADLVGVAQHYPMASLRRLGWLLEYVEAPIDVEPLRRAISAQEPQRRRPVTLLDPAAPHSGHGDQRWGVVVNMEVEPDL